MLDQWCLNALNPFSMTCTCVGDSFSDTCPIPEHAAAARQRGGSDTGWKPIKIVGGDGDRAAGGQIELVKANEARPCGACASWEKDDHKLISHLIAKRFDVMPDGTFKSPIRKDFKGTRANLTIDPKKFGFCRYETSITEDLATCDKWTPVRTVEELARRFRNR